MPHRRDVEAAADLEALRDMREVHRLHQEIRDALVALDLEMVLGQPERVVAMLVARARQRFGLGEDADQVLVRVAAVVGRRRVLAHVAELDVCRVARSEATGPDLSSSPVYRSVL